MMTMVEGDPGRVLKFQISVKCGINVKCGISMISKLRGQDNLSEVVFLYFLNVLVI